MLNLKKLSDFFRESPLAKVDLDLGRTHRAVRKRRETDHSD
jgi:hypothetical protein